MLKQLRRVSRKPKQSQPAYRPPSSLPPARLVLTTASLSAMRACMAPEIAMGHEGIAYLLGQTNGTTTIVIGAIRPDSQTTKGSFNVSSIAMARVVRKASNAGLEVVGQIHTHPCEAYHSGGDEDGARIAYNGYTSIVIPDYGHQLPSLAGAAIYFYRDRSFTALKPKTIQITDGTF
jgi:proteasome lid subunit RPN8/RPN11